MARTVSGRPRHATGVDPDRSGGPRNLPGRGGPGGGAWTPGCWSWGPCSRASPASSRCWPSGARPPRARITCPGAIAWRSPGASGWGAQPSVKIVPMTAVTPVDPRRGGAGCCSAPGARPCPWTRPICPRDPLQERPAAPGPRGMGPFPPPYATDGGGLRGGTRSLGEPGLRSVQRPDERLARGAEPLTPTPLPQGERGERPVEDRGTGSPSPLVGEGVGG